MTARDGVKFIGGLAAIVLVAGLIITGCQAVVAYMRTPAVPGLPQFSLWQVVWPDERELFSLQSHIPPVKLAAGIEVSLMLAIGAVILAAWPAIPVGIWAALRQNRWFTHIGPATSLLVQGVPT